MEAHAPVPPRLPSDTAPATAATTSSKRRPTDVKGSTVGLGEGVLVALGVCEGVWEGDGVPEGVGPGVDVPDGGGQPLQIRLDGHPEPLQD